MDQSVQYIYLYMDICVSACHVFEMWAELGLCHVS